MSGLAFLGLVMLVVMIGAIFIGFRSASRFSCAHLRLPGEVVFSLAYFQTIGMMKEELLAAVPLFIFMGLHRAGGADGAAVRRAPHAPRADPRPLFAVVILTATIFAMATGIVGGDGARHHGEPDHGATGYDGGSPARSPPAARSAS